MQFAASCRCRRMSSHIPVQAPISRDASPVKWLAAHLPHSAAAVAAADRPVMLSNRWHLYGGALSQNFDWPQVAPTFQYAKTQGMFCQHAKHFFFFFTNF